MKIVKTFDITEQQIQDLLVTAFEGGINYWCDRVEITVMPPNTSPEDYDKLMASQVIAKDGIVELRGEDFEKITLLTRDKMLTGISKAMDWGNFASIEELIDNHDAETADIIVQYAIFDEIIFG